MLNNFSLSKRLQAVFELVPEVAYILDIGTDHAYLPLAIMQRDHVKQIFASEAARGPFENAKSNIAAANYSKDISMLLGDGFEVVKVIEKSEKIEAVTICGMGGELIADIIKDGVEQHLLPAQATLVLQPNNHEKKLRQQLMSLNYKIIDEQVVTESSHFYEIIKAVPAKDSVQYSDDELIFGPQLLKTRSKVFIEKWHKKLVHFKKIEQSLKYSQKTSAQRIKEIKQMIARIEKVIK